MAKSKLSPSDFVHLHNHTQYSLLDGLTKIPALVEHVDKLGMRAVAVTDHGTMSGTIEFYKAAKASGIKPIIGMETYMAPRRHTDKDPNKDKTPYHLILLAMNNKGYENLMQLSTTANLDGFYYKPRIDRELLKKHNEGLIVLSGCIGGEVGDSLRQGQYDQAKKTAEWYKSVFGDRYYIEIQDHGHPKHDKPWDEQIAVTNESFRLAKELDVSCVLTCDAHYLQHQDQEAHEVLLCVQTGSFMSDSKRMSLSDFDLHVTDPKEIITRWEKDHPEIIINSGKIAERCDVELSLGNILIPKFDVPTNETEAKYLEKLTYQGLARRYDNKSEEEASQLSVTQAKKILPKAVSDRAAYELGVIEQMGFCGYFLIIADFMHWGKARGIVFGPGRGSAAGSIIAYALRITELDPIKYDLLFERFLNPDRISMPDIDIDIQDTRRSEVISYCVDKYGKDRVANIVTFGTMAARNAVRDVARVLQVPYAEADRLAKMIPPPVQGRHIPLAQSLKTDAELKKEYEANESTRKVFDLAIRLEGTIRSHGVHAAGVVIAPDYIVKYAPLEKASNGVVATQYSMYPIMDDLGLLKMDFLGLSNLTIIKNTLRIIKKVHGKDIEISEVPLDDDKTFSLLQRGDTTGVFQLESSGMKRYLKELSPSVFEDIVAMVSLYRPGPLTAGLTDRFIARKNGQEAVTYDHESMQNSLKTTYGVLVYQEQVMQIAKDMCGFTGGEADTLRKAVGKKNRDMMKKMKDKIISGAVANNVPKAIAEKFWTDLEGFADYAFNKSHAACYALIAYQTAYLKAHFPAAFMAALMTSDFDNIDRLAIEIKECRAMGIDVLPPDINESFVEFAVVPKTNQIRFGMNAVKNVGTGAVEEILRAREEGEFSSLEDFCRRVNVRIVNRKALESLIKSGAFDRFADRNTLLTSLDVLLAYASRIQKQQQSGQTDLFGGMVNTIPDESLQLNLKSQEQASAGELLQWERELLGIYLSSHPLADYETWLSEKTMPLNSLTAEYHDAKVTVGGTISGIKLITAKNGKKMAFVKIADMTGELEAIIFPNVYSQSEEIIIEDSVVVGKGKLSAKDRNGRAGEIKVLLDSITRLPLDKAKGYKPKNRKLEIQSLKPRSASLKIATPVDSKLNNSISARLYIRVEKSDNHEQLLSLKNILDEHHGATEVVLVVGNNNLKQAIKLPVKTDCQQGVLDKLKSVVGSDNVKVQ